MKPYAYGVLALLIVGLSFFSWIQQLRLEIKIKENAELALAVATLKEKNLDLVAAASRKAGAADAYVTITQYINTLTKDASSIIKGYKLRIEENEKCLDMQPPASMLERLRENYNRG